MRHFREPQRKQKGNVVVVILLLVAMAVAIGYFLMSKDIIKNPFQSSFSNSSLGSQIFKKVQDSSGKKATETNPFAKINPFKGVYKNPFE